MHLYKRGKIWWIEYERQGKRYRISTHKTDKKDARSVFDVVHAGVSEKSPLAVQVTALCALYGKSLREALPELCAAADTGLDVIKRESRTALNRMTNPLIDADAFDPKDADSGDEVWRLYLKNMDALNQRPARADTLQRRRSVYHRFAEWLADVAPLASTVRDVNGAIAMNYAIELAAGDEETGERKSTKTRKNILGELGTIWKVLEKMCGVENVWRDISPKDTDGKVGEAFTRQEEMLLFAAAKEVGKGWYEVCKIMRLTGLRYADVARLTWKEIDLDESMIHRVPTKTARHGIAVHVPICSALHDVFSGMERIGEYLFPFHAELYGNRGRAAREALSFGEVLAAAGIRREGVTVHSWRHTFITRLAEAGIDKETRMRLAGHTQGETSDRYNHAKYFALDMKAVEAAA